MTNEIRQNRKMLVRSILSSYISRNARRMEKKVDERTTTMRPGCKINETKAITNREKLEEWCKCSTHVQMTRWNRGNDVDSSGCSNSISNQHFVQLNRNTFRSYQNANLNIQLFNVEENCIHRFYTAFSSCWTVK